MEAGRGVRPGIEALLRARGGLSAEGGFRNDTCNDERSLSEVRRLVVAGPGWEGGGARVSVMARQPSQRQVVDQKLRFMVLMPAKRVCGRHCLYV